MPLRSFRLTLQQKFVVLTSMAILLLMSGLGYLAARHESALLYDDIERQGRILAETLAIPVMNDLIYERLGLVEEGGLIDNYLTGVFGKKELDLLSIAILDEKGTVLSHNDFSQYGRRLDDAFTVRALASDRTIVASAEDEGSGHRALDFATPLSIGTKRWGTLAFRVSLEKVDHEIAAMIRNVIVLTVLILAGGFVLIAVMSRRFIGPITALARTMERAGSDTLDVRAEVVGHDELALLGRSFNNMIDRIREANEELRRTHEKLLQSEKLASIGILAAGVAHEINNPLGGLFNCVEMLKERGDEPAFRERYLGLIREALERIEATVGKLLWMARKKEGKPTDVIVASVVEDLTGFIAYQLRKANIRLDVAVPENLTVWIDYHDLHQVLLNLCLNAIQAMPSGGRLSIRGRRDGDLAEIELRDTGSGIAPEDRSRIFDPFFTTKSPGEGTGLGLWLTYEVIKNYDGDISVESEPGRGTCFRVRLAVKPSIPPVAADTPS